MTTITSSIPRDRQGGGGEGSTSFNRLPSHHLALPLAHDAPTTLRQKESAISVLIGRGKKYESVGSNNSFWQRGGWSGGA